MIRILVVEDSPIVRKGVSQLINGQPDLSVVMEAVDGKAALSLIEGGLNPDIILTDLNMPGMDGFEFISKLQEMHCPVKVIILTMHRFTNYLEKALLCGASGYLLKGEEEEELFAAIRAVFTGKIFISSSPSLVI